MVLAYSDRQVREFLTSMAARIRVGKRLIGNSDDGAHNTGIEEIELGLGLFPDLRPWLPGGQEVPHQGIDQGLEEPLDGGSCHPGVTGDGRSVRIPGKEPNRRTSSRSNAGPSS